jgi:hypothetical protein
VAVDPSKAYLTGDGPVCDACQSRGEVDDAFASAAKYYPSASVSLALVSFVFNPFFAFTVASIAIAATGMSKLTRGETGEDYARALGPKRRQYVIGCVAAIALAVVPVALRIALTALR